MSHLASEQFDVIVPVVLKEQLHVLQNRRGQYLDGGPVGQPHSPEDVAERRNRVQEL